MHQRIPDVFSARRHVPMLLSLPIDRNKWSEENKLFVGRMQQHYSEKNGNVLHEVIEEIMSFAKNGKHEHFSSLEFAIDCLRHLLHDADVLVNQKDNGGKGKTPLHKMVLSVTLNKNTKEVDIVVLSAANQILSLLLEAGAQLESTIADTKAKAILSGIILSRVVGHRLAKEGWADKNADACTILMPYMASAFLYSATALKQNKAIRYITDFLDAAELECLHDNIIALHNLKFKHVLREDFNVLNYLVSLVSINEESLLHFIAEKAYFAQSNRENVESAISLLIASGVHVDYCNKYSGTKQATPLMYAIMYGNEVAANALLHRRANVDTQDKHNRTPLHYCSLYTNVTLTRTLLEQGAPVDKRDRDMVTPLMVACKKGSIEIVESLIKADAGVDLQDSEGKTALFYVAISGYKDVAQLLVNAGARLDALDMYNKTATEYAGAQGNKEVYQLLLGEVRAKQEKQKVNPQMHAKL